MGYVLSRPATVVADVLAWALFHAATGYAAHRVAERRLGRDWFVHRPRRFEREGEWYARRLRVKRWKGWLPEAGDLFRGGFDKSRVTSTEPSYLERYVRETRRAELAHWWCLSCSPLFGLWNPPAVVAAMVAYGVVANVPCIVAVRYNRFRLQRILRKRND